MDAMRDTSDKDLARAISMSLQDCELGGGRGAGMGRQEGGS